MMALFQHLLMEASVTLVTQPGSAAGDAAQAGRVDDVHLLPGEGDQALLGEALEQPARA